MYYHAISQCAQALLAIDTYLREAEKYAAEKKFDVEVLLTSRLAPDMKPLIYQIQSACDYLKGGAAWLSGQTPPRHEDTERTIDEVRARIHKTVAFARSVTADQYKNASEQTVKLSWAPNKIIRGQDYLLQVIIPNVYFHAAMSYAILRQSGVNVGKMDFLGEMNFVDP
jgi:hypothetical protein